MGFEQISGSNARVREYLEGAFARGAVPHAFLISGAPGSGKHALAELLSCALVCTGEHPPCGACPACKKARAGLHPDILRVDSGAASIKVDTIRAVRQDAFLVPNDGARKVYVIDHAERMTQDAQDALLKILEEPPEFTSFLLLCYNHNSLLPTVLSRVTHLKLYSPEDAALSAPDEEALAAASALAGAFAQRDELGILQALITCEKKKREEMQAIFALLLPILRDAMTQGAVPPLLPQAQRARDALAARCTRQELLALCARVEEARQLIAQNVGVAHVMGMLAVQAHAILK